MTKTVVRYSFCANEAPHIRERADGVWVRYEDIKHLLQQSEPESTLGVKVVIDESMPPDEVRMRNSLGQEVRVTGIATSLRMPQGALETRCIECGWTFGTHAPFCSKMQTRSTI